MTREEQIKHNAERYANRYEIRGTSEGEYRYMDKKDAYIAGAEWADANQPNPWISVEDKLPDDGVLVIVAYRWILGEILYASDVFHIDYGWEDYDDVVAWMPIPELPKEE